MPVVPQPSENNDNGVVLTVGIVSNNQRSALVIPVFTDNVGLDLASVCNDAVISFQSGPLPLLRACLSSDAFVSHVAGESMIDGLTPSRIDFAPADFPGTGPAVCAPNQVAGMIFFYIDPIEGIVTRTRVAKNSVPGLPSSWISNDTLIDAAVTALLDLATALQNGFLSSGDVTKKWYRALRAPVPRTPGTHVKRVLAFGTRRYVVTQRRRLTPR